MDDRPSGDYAKTASSVNEIKGAWILAGQNDLSVVYGVLIYIDNERWFPVSN